MIEWFHLSLFVQQVTFEVHVAETTKIRPALRKNDDLSRSVSTTAPVEGLETVAKFLSWSMVSVARFFTNVKCATKCTLKSSYTHVNKSNSIYTEQLEVVRQKEVGVNDSIYPPK